MTSLNIDPSSNALEFARFHRACTPALEWLAKKPNQSVLEAYKLCPSIKWQMWLLKKAKMSQVGFVERAIWCARGVLHLVPKKEDCALLTIQAAERCLVDPSQENITVARSCAARATALATAARCTATASAAEAARSASADSYAAAAYFATAAAAYTDQTCAFSSIFAERFPLEGLQA